MSFLDLPPELRNIIYEFALVYKEEKERTRSGYGFSCPGRGVNFAMLLSCRQVHAEGARMLYSENNFTLATYNILNCCSDPSVFKSEESVFNPFQIRVGDGEAVQASLYAPLIRKINYMMAETSSSHSSHVHVWEIMLRHSCWLSRNFKGLTELNLTLSFQWTEDWLELMIKENSESKGERIKRIRQWMRTMYELKQQKVLPCLKLKIDQRDPPIRLLRTHGTEGCDYKSAIADFKTALELFKSKQR